ncbi:MAG TPA: hypothetical protein VN376_05090 [Longilinea sp.]|nr:hypothetical protein [Longilinea sp.]
MNSNLSKVLITAGLFLVIFILGYVMNRSGKPYSVLLLTVHKLASLGILVYLIVTAVQLNKVSPLTGLELTAVIAAVVFFVAAIVTGGLVSVDKPMPDFVSWLHKIIPYLALLSSAASFYLLLWRR